MNYTITEEECNALDAARGQLNLVADLLGVKGAESAPCNASDLCYFLSAQMDALKAIINAVEDRHKASWDENNTLSWIDWRDIIQVASGRGLQTSARLKAIGRKLQNSVKTDPDMAHVLQAWSDAMTDGGSLPFNLEPSSTDGFLIRFEERVPVVVPPLPAAATATATVKKPTMRKRDKLAAAVTC